MRSAFTWRLKTRSLELGARTLLMGVVNVTPDSFSDGGDHFDHHKAIDHALHLFGQGADILDIGGESTRPGAAVGQSGAVPEGEELRRILPVLAGVLKQRPEAIISVDTYKACVARAAVEAGAEIVNDVSGGGWDDAMLAAMAATRCGVVLNHTRGRPEEWKSQPKQRDLISSLKSGLAKVAGKAIDAGIARESIVLDPGFGFGKGMDENYEMLARFDEFAQLKFPLLAGPSRKGFIGKALAEGRGTDDVPPQERLFGTLAAVTACILRGAHVVRIHDVRAARDAALVADRVVNGQ